MFKKMLYGDICVYYLILMIFVFVDMCVRACVRACVHARVRVRVCVFFFFEEVENAFDAPCQELL